MKKNKLVAEICHNFADLVSGCDNYDDYYSLKEAIEIALNKLPDDIDREDVDGWLNPHLDWLAEEWDDTQ